jgi:hypothetical protein
MDPGLDFVSLLGKLFSEVFLFLLGPTDVFFVTTVALSICLKISLSSSVPDPSPRIRMFLGFLDPDP